MGQQHFVTFVAQNGKSATLAKVLVSGQVGVQKHRNIIEESPCFAKTQALNNICSNVCLYIHS
jgi:hypothetical protein